jgi:ribosomal protein L31
LIAYPDIIGKKNAGENATQYQSLPVSRTNVMLEPNRTLIFEPGDYTNEYRRDETYIASHLTTGDYAGYEVEYYAPFQFQDNCYITSKKGAKLFQNSETYSDRVSMFYPIFMSNKEIENVSIENLHILFGGALSTSGKGGVIGSGHVKKLKIKGIIFDETTGYPIVIVGAGEREYYPEEVTIEDCEGYNIWTYAYNVLRGVDVRIRNCWIHNKTVPTTQLRQDNGRLVTQYTGSVGDVEANSTQDKVEKIIYEDCGARLPEEMPATVINGTTNPDSNPFVYYYSGLYLQGIDAGITNVKVKGFTVSGKNFGSFGAWKGIDAYGVDTLTLENVDLSHFYDMFLNVNLCKDVTLDGITLKDGVNYVNHPTFPNSNINLKWKGLTTHRITTPTVHENPNYFPVVALGTNLYTPHPIGDYTQTKWRLYPSMLDGEISFNGQTIKGTSLFYPTVLSSIIRRMTVNYNFGTPTGTTFVNADVSTNGVNKTAHPFYTGQMVLLSSSGTLPSFSRGGSPIDTLKIAYVRSESANRFTLWKYFSDAVDYPPEDTVVMTIDTASATGTHTITPFAVPYKVIPTTDVNVADDKIGWTAHPFVNDAYVEYVNVGGTVIGGLTNNGIYQIANKATNDFQLRDIATGSIISISGTGTATHVIIPVFKDMFTKSHPSEYYFDDNISTSLRNDGKSKVKKILSPTDSVGTLPIVETTVFSPNDTYLERFAKIQELLLANVPPPVWYAKRFFHRRPSTLVSTVANGAALADITSETFSGVGSFEWEQDINTALRGELYHVGDNNAPFIRVGPSEGYEPNEALPVTTSFGIGMVAKISPGVTEGNYSSGLNDNDDTGQLSHNAEFLFSLAYGGNLRFYNHGLVYQETMRSDLLVIFIWIDSDVSTGFTKLYINGTEVASNTSLKVIPSHLNIGHPYNVASVGAGLDIYEIALLADVEQEDVDSFNELGMGGNGITG